MAETKVVTERDGLRLVWTTGAKGECNVDVYDVAATAALYSDVAATESRASVVKA